MSVPPVDIAKAVANPRLLDGQSIQVNVGELRKLVARAGLVLDPMKRGAPPAAVDDLADSAAEPLRMAAWLAANEHAEDGVTYSMSKAQVKALLAEMAVPDDVRDILGMWCDPLQVPTSMHKDGTTILAWLRTLPPRKRKRPAIMHTSVAG